MAQNDQSPGLSGVSLSYARYCWVRLDIWPATLQKKLGQFISPSEIIVDWLNCYFRYLNSGKDWFLIQRHNLEQVLLLFRRSSCLLSVIMRILTVLCWLERTTGDNLSWSGDGNKLCFKWNQYPVADPGFGQGGGPQNFFPRFCRRHFATSGERSEPILAGVQGPP